MTLMVIVNKNQQLMLIINYNYISWYLLCLKKKVYAVRYQSADVFLLTAFNIRIDEFIIGLII